MTDIRDSMKVDQAVTAFMQKKPEERESMLFREVLNTQLKVEAIDVRVTKIDDEGCSQRSEHLKVVSSKRGIHPAITGTAAASVVYGVLEGIKMFFATGGKAHP